MNNNVAEIQMIVYLARPISGGSYADVVSYFDSTKLKLRKIGFDALSPMTAKESLRTEIKLKAHGYDNVPTATNHAIVERDMWMLMMSDIVYCNLLGAKIVSIGSVMELGWAHMLRKHTIIVMEKDNIHQHAFVIEAGDIIFETEEEAIQYLKELIS